MLMISAQRQALLLPLVSIILLRACDNAENTSPFLEGNYQLQKQVEDVTLGKEGGQVNESGACLGQDPEQTRSFEIGVHGTDDYLDTHIILANMDKRIGVTLKDTTNKDTSQVKGDLSSPYSTEAGAVLQAE